MSFLDLEINDGRSHWWAYSEQSQNYRQGLTGTVVKFQQVPVKDFNTGAPRFFPDGNPMMQIRMVLCEEDGDYTLVEFKRKSKLHEALWAICGNSLESLIGKTIDLWTAPGVYNQQHPRPFYCQLSDQGPYKLNKELPAEYSVDKVLPDNAVHGGQLQQPQQQQAQQAQQAQQVPQQTWQPPAQTQPVQQPTYQQQVAAATMPPAQQQQVPQQTWQPPAQTQPKQQAQSTQAAQPSSLSVDPQGNVYDPDIPF